MEPSKQSDDRWQELADLLGLPSSEQGAASPAETKPISPVHHVEPEPARAEVPHADEQHEAIEDNIEVIDDNLVDDPELSEAAADEEMGEEDEEGAEAAEGVPGEEVGQLPGDEDKPKRGRRRRRRGRRRGGDKPEGEVAGQPPAVRSPETRDSRQGQPRQRDDRNARPAQPSRDRDAHPSNDHAESRPRRGGRDESQETRRPNGEEFEEVNEELDEVETSPAPALARNLDDDTDFSDWSVPSWQELISSLHRPDR